MTTAAPEASALRGARRWFAIQLAIGWLPVLALYAITMVVVHGIRVETALIVSARAILGAALLGILVLRFVERHPWPRRVTAGFVLLHVGGAVGYSVLWVALSIVIESIVRGSLAITPPALLAAFVLLGLWLYIAVAGVSYAVQATARAARAEAAAVRAQLAALRGQLNPHFLFNALHTVVHLIPIAPDRAATSAELLAGLLRQVLEEDRDRVALREERTFVEKYVALEQVRFDERLVVTWEIPEAAADAYVPAFALQTLVENAVRHGASSRIEPTHITIAARIEGETLTITCGDDGAGADLTGAPTPNGTGLRRLRERLDALYGPRATLTCTSSLGRGFTARINLPLDHEGDVA